MKRAERLVQNTFVMFLDILYSHTRERERARIFEGSFADENYL